MPFPTSWVMKLPNGLREQSGWIFIGLLVMLSGIGYMIGIARSAVTEAIGSTGLKGWGAFLAVTGFLVVYATWCAKPALEKMALRWLSFALLAYGAWLAVAIPPALTVMPLTLIVILVGLAEIRVGFIKLTLNLAAHYKDLGDGSNDSG